MTDLKLGMNKPELLAPAGNLEKLKFAVHYGADAVYIGGQQYGLRSNADNFSFEDMREGGAHRPGHGAKVYVTTNIFAHDEDLAGIADYLRELEDAGIAAIITADPAIMEIARRVAPRLEVHLSTQQSTLNWLAVQFWKEEGLPRVVLAREVEHGGYPGDQRPGQYRDRDVHPRRHVFLAIPGGACCRTTLPDGIRTVADAPSPADGSMICMSRTVSRWRGWSGTNTFTMGAEGSRDD